ncbi:MAG: cytochrome P450 [Myxococcota bacterium]
MLGVLRGIEIDLMNPEDPARRFAAMAKLRAEAPIHALGGGEGPWYLARRDAVTEALPQVLHFGGGVGAGDVPVDDQALNGVLEPRHGEFRRLVNGLIAPHKARRVKPFLETELCPRLLEAVAERAARDENVDIMNHYLDHVPSSAIAWLLGWPIEDALQLYQWTLEICERGMEMRPGTDLALREIHPVFSTYVEKRLAERLALPESEWPEDGISKLLVSEVEGERLSPAAVRTQLMFLLGAGSETTRDMLGGLVFELARDPALYERLRGDRSGIANACEEALRIYSPTQFMVRRCLQPVSIAEHAFAAGELVFFGLASANRDEAHFEEGERFDAERANAADHLALGAGPHLCLGASLLRLETQIAIGSLLDRFEAIELAEGPGFEALPTAMFYGPKRLPLRLHPA